MSESKSSLGIYTFHLSFICFIALKVGGAVYTVTWSWWWLLLPQAPVLATIFRHLGVL